MRYLLDKIVVGLLKIYLRTILITCKWKTENLSVLTDATKKDKPIMLACWHENLVFLACFFKNWEKKLWVISSTHRDSEMLASILKSWGFNLIKGSSTRGWLGVLKKLLTVFSTKNSIVAITNDGPRGPAKEAKPGALKAAIKKNVRIIGMSGEAKSFWRLNTWDKMMLPKPFTTITVRFNAEYNKEYSVEKFNQYLNNQTTNK